MKSEITPDIISPQERFALILLEARSLGKSDSVLVAKPNPGAQATVVIRLEAEGNLINPARTSIRVDQPPPKLNFQAKGTKVKMIVARTLTGMKDAVSSLVREATTMRILVGAYGNLVARVTDYDKVNRVVDGLIEGREGTSPSVYPSGLVSVEVPNTSFLGRLFGLKTRISGFDQESLLRAIDRLPPDQMGLAREALQAAGVGNSQPAPSSGPSVRSGPSPILVEAARRGELKTY